SFFRHRLNPIGFPVSQFPKILFRILIYIYFPSVAKLVIPKSRMSGIRHFMRKTPSVIIQRCPAFHFHPLPSSNKPLPTFYATPAKPLLQPELGGTCPGRFG